MDKRINMDLKFKIDNVDMHVSVENLVQHNTENDSSIKNFHYHVMYEMFFIQNVPLILYTDGKISEFKNCIVCIPPYARHRVLSWQGERMMFSFKNDVKNHGTFAKFIDKFFSRTHPFEIKTDDTLNMYVDNLLRMFNTDMTTKSEFMVSVVKLIFYNIYKNNADNKKSSLFANESYLVKIDDIINNFQSDISLKTIADELKLSTKQVSRIIKKNYNKNLSGMVKEKRLAVASELLLSSDMTILEIAEYVNFSSESYFYSEFKKAFGCTPLKYKKTNRLEKQKSLA